MKVRIRLWGTDHQNIDYVSRQIVEIAKKAGVEVKGPIPLPTKRLVVSTLRLPHGEGTKVYEKWEMRIHKRLIDVAADERVMRQIMRIRVPQNVYIEVEIIR
ncbi:MAG: 30S ribosomal protein S10 [Desulfurococcales archaeon]|jgi:SSU ribosomal protein S10P|nr:30S ribosomal protein S10 [Desulfurococcales archaeon]MCC6061918.1 30S ribosomal protein S10 [Desulfurococcales archaeon]NAZ13107.1 30S ribosomal protein S10 [Desulfurococcales archaeon]